MTNFEDMSFRELRELVEKTEGKSLPTAKALRESGAEIFSKKDDVTVFRNGFALIGCDNHFTVLGIDRIEKIASDSEGEKSYSAEEIGSWNWYLAIYMAGSERLMHNADERENDHHEFSLSNTEDWNPAVSFEDKYMEKEERRENHEKLLEGIETLTEREKQAINLRLAGLKEQQIAEEMGVSQPRVVYLYQSSIKKLKKFFEKGL